MWLQRSSPSLLIAYALALACSRPSAVSAQVTPLVVSTKWLGDHLRDPDLVLLQIGGRMGRDEDAEHIPGARIVRYMSLVQDVGGISSELPSADSLRSLFEKVGVSDNSHVVLTGPPLAVTRAFFTLDYLGHARTSVLTGGLTQWKTERRPVSTEWTRFAAGRLTPRKPRAEVVATTDWVRQHAGKPGVSLFDTRTEGEYLGTHSAAGHIEGARRIEWQDFLADSDELVLADTQTLTRLWTERLNAPTDTVVAYCQVGYRASGTYFVSRLLGIPVKLYDGSYNAWSKQGLPVVRSVTPLRPLPARNGTGGDNRSSRGLLAM